MKRKLCVLLALCLLLCGCTAAPAETTAPETTAQVTTAPVETTVPETTVPETTVPETTAPAVFVPYTITRDGEEEWLYAGPGFAWGVSEMIIDQKEFRINAEATDRDGNLWGQTEDGQWLCLTEPAIVPVRAEYAPEGAQADEIYTTGETEYVTHMRFTAEKNLRNVKFCSTEFADAGYAVDEILHEIPVMEVGATFRASVVFYGDFTTYVLSFAEEDGTERFFSLYISGRDGSLVCSEYLPE